MKNKSILLTSIIILLAVCNNSYANKYSICEENWYQAEDDHVIKVSSNTCKMENITYEDNSQNYSLVKNKWYLVDSTRAKGPCYTMKMCDYKTIDYYFISDDKDHFTQLPYNYSKDSKSVYYRISAIKNSDPKSFKILNENYAVDNNSVYYKGKVIPSADPKTFRILNDYYSVDQNFVFVNNKQIEGANPKDFDIFKKTPDKMYGSWAHDKNYLYYYNYKIPIQLDPSKFHYITANIFTDDNKVVELAGENIHDENKLRLRDDIALPITKLSSSSFIDGKKKLFINTQQGTAKVVPEINGSTIKTINATCPTKEYPHLIADCKEALNISSEQFFFEDDKQVYFMYSKYNYGNSYVFDLEPIFKKKINKPIYLFSISHRTNIIHDSILYSNIGHREQTPRNFVSTKIEGDLLGESPYNTLVISDNAGFISLSTISDKDPNKLFRSFTKQEFGLLHLANKQFDNAYVLENNRYFFILLKNRSPQQIDNYIVDKQTLTVKSMQLDIDITEGSATLLKQLGLIKKDGKQ